MSYHRHILSPTGAIAVCRGCARKNGLHATPTGYRCDHCQAEWPWGKTLGLAPMGAEGANYVAALVDLRGSFHAYRRGGQLTPLLLIKTGVKGRIDALHKAKAILGVGTVYTPRVRAESKRGGTAQTPRLQVAGWLSMGRLRELTPLLLPSTQLALIDLSTGPSKEHRAMTKPLEPSQMFDALLGELGEDLDSAMPRLTMGNPVSAVGRYVLEAGFATLLAQRRHAERMRLKLAAPRGITKRDRERAKAALMELYTHWMVGTVALGNADKPLLLSAAQREEALAAGHVKNAEFYRQLAERLPEGKTVAQGININEAQEIRERVFLHDNA